MKHRNKLQNKVQTSDTMRHIKLSNSLIQNKISVFLRLSCYRRKSGIIEHNQRDLHSRTYNYRNVIYSIQEVMGRTNRLIFFDITDRKENEKKIGETHRQQGDIISLLTKIRERYTDRHRRIHRQQGDLISVLLFFQNKESRRKRQPQSRQGLRRARSRV
jgi:hypothetical protein